MTAPGLYVLHASVSAGPRNCVGLAPAPERLIASVSCDASRSLSALLCAAVIAIGARVLNHLCVWYILACWDSVAL